MKGLISAKRLFAASAFSILAAFSVSASAPSGYYNSLEGLSGTSLKNAVKAIGKKGHKAISYGDATWRAFRSTDVRKVNGQDCWWDMYSTNNVPVSSGHPGMNIEHSVANSWWGGTKNNAYKDIVHLNPSNADANSKKSNYPLGIADPSYNKYFNNGATIVSKAMPGYGGGNSMVYEPCDEYKGDFARVFMYMFTIYDDIAWSTTTNWMYENTKPVTFKKWAADMILQWSANDPVSDKERYRNDGIHKEQGNRNPFIDLPDLADYIWGSKRGEAYHLDGSHEPDPVDPDPNPDPDPDPNPDPDPDPVELEGTYLKVTAQSDIKAGERYVVAAAIDNPVALSTTLSGKFFTHTAEVTVTDNVITTLPEGTAVIKLESASGAYLLHMEDATGKSYGYINSTSAKTMTLSETPPSAGCTLTVSSKGTAISFGSAGNLEYNTGAPRFTTYQSSSNQTPVNLFRYIPRTSAVTDIETDTDDSFLVEVWGNNIFTPDGARIFDLNGREVDGANLEKGIYIVVKPTFRKAVKIII